MGPFKHTGPVGFNAPTGQSNEEFIARILVPGMFVEAYTSEIRNAELVIRHGEVIGIVSKDRSMIPGHTIRVDFGDFKLLVEPSQIFRIFDKHGVLIGNELETKLPVQSALTPYGQLLGHQEMNDYVAGSVQMHYLSTPKSISDDDICSECHNCKFNVGELSTCNLHWPGTLNADQYIVSCEKFARIPGDSEFK